MRTHAARLLTFSSYLYSAVLKLYPAPLRARYGSEMEEVFFEQTRDAWRENGAVGLGRVWLYVAKELIASALPTCLRLGGIGVIALSGSLTFFYVICTGVPPFSPFPSRAIQPCATKIHLINRNLGVSK